MKKRETLEEYIARGGEITRCDAQDPEHEEIVVRSAQTGLPQLMSLADGAHFFGETRRKKKKPMSKTDFLNKIDEADLPSDVVESLKKAIGANSER